MRARRGAEVLLVTDAAWTIDRLPIPSILATGAVHTALTTAGLRGRTDLAVSAVDVLDVHAMAMFLAVGATAVQPRLAIELAAELAGTRGAEEKTPTETVDRAAHGVRGRVCARPSPGWASAPSPRTSVARSSTSWISMRPSWRGVSRRPRRGRAGRRSPTWPSGRSAAGRRRWRSPNRRPGASHGCPIPGSPGSAPTARRTCSRRRIAGEITLLAVGGPDGVAVEDVDARLARYRAAVDRPASDRAVPRDELRIRRQSGAARRSTRSRTPGRSSVGSSSRR